MNEKDADLRGRLNLLAEGGRTNGISSGYRGHANIKGATRQDSYFVLLISKQVINPGETCEAYFGFLFRDDDRFSMDVEIGDVFELNEGARKVGEFTVTEILNEKLKTTHNRS